MIRSTQDDIDDPNANLKDPNWHCDFIKSHANGSILGALKPSVTVEGDQLVFSAGMFKSEWLRKLVMPTMKGFWVPVKVRSAATLLLRMPELIGLKNCANYVSGMIQIDSRSLRSLELIPITKINELDIGRCENLKTLDGLPTIARRLQLAPNQLKLNLANVFNACDASAEIFLYGSSINGLSISSSKKLASIVNAGILRKGSPSMTERKALLQLQTDLIDHDFEEYSDI